MVHSRFRVPGVVAAALVALSVAVFPQTAVTPATPAPLIDAPTLRIVVLDTEDEARRVREELLRGANFVALATARSVDPSAADGGMLGPTPLSSLRPELRKAVDGLSIGGLSPVVSIPAGFAVVQRVADRDGLAREESPRGVNAGLAAGGSVKYVFDVSGFADAIEVMRQYPKEPGWNQDLKRICNVRLASLQSARDRMEQRLASTTDLADPLDRAEAHVLVGQLHAYQGHIGPAIAAWERALEVAKDIPSMHLAVTEGLGVAHLHKASLDNGAFNTSVEPCVLCPGERVGFKRTDDVTRAVDYFSRYLAEKPEEIEVRWLLNLAYMMLGRYPGSVPAQYLIAPAALHSAEDVGRFVDVAHESGLDSFAAAGGLIVDDFDGDGLLDVVTSSMDTCQEMHFFRRTESGRFARASVENLAGQLGGLNLVHADYDNDGCPDILVLRGGWEVAQRKSLLHNDCRGSFTDVTAAVGLADPATSTQTAAWVDFDNDGRLDLFVGNENAPAQLFRQQPNGTFVDVAAAAGVAQSAFTKGVTAADYDNDGWPDLYASNNAGRNFLYRNNGNGTFTELGRAAGVPGPGRGFATWFFDYDNDGWQDLFVASYFISVEESARTYMGLPNNANTLKLYRNLGDGTFRDVTRQVALDKVFMPMGANFGDIDNDGFLDIYLGTGNPSFASLLPNVLLRNRGGTSFVDVTASSGTGEWHKGHGVAFADLDDDGDEEIIEEIGGAAPGDAHMLRLYENPGHGNDWLNVTLSGRRTNRSAIGARMTVTVEDRAGARRSIHRTVGSGGSFGDSPLRQHLGLGRSARIVSLDIWWPTSGTRQRFTDVAVNQSIEVTESSQDYKRLTPRRLPLGPRRIEK
jgi:FG-GAP-like repeat/ASPIC and UnbV/PPIC-type PPIASE domain